MSYEREDIMSGIVGGLMAFGGVVELFRTLEFSTHLTKNIRVANGQEDSTTKRIARIVANIFNLVGRFSIAVGMITMGATLFTFGPTLGFLDGINQAIGASIPYLVGSLANLGTGLIIHQIAR